MCCDLAVVGCFVVADCLKQIQYGVIGYCVVVVVVQFVVLSCVEVGFCVGYCFVENGCVEMYCTAVNCTSFVVVVWVDSCIVSVGCIVVCCVVEPGGGVLTVCCVESGCCTVTCCAEVGIGSCCAVLCGVEVEFLV